PTLSVIYTLSLHDALPIFRRRLAPKAARRVRRVLQRPVRGLLEPRLLGLDRLSVLGAGGPGGGAGGHLQGAGVRRREGVRNLGRSEEHTSELQSRSELVCR